MKTVFVLTFIGLALGKPAPQGLGKPSQGLTGGLPKKKLWLTIDDNSLEVFNPLNPSPASKINVAYSKVDGKAVPNYHYGSSEELDYGSRSVAYAKSQFKSQPLKTQGNPNFYYDNSGELKIVPNPDMVSQVYSQFYSSLPVQQGPNDPRYYIDSSGELGLASDFFMTRLVQSNQDPNLYRDNSGELLYVYPKGSHSGNFQSGIPAAGNSAVQKTALNPGNPNFHYDNSGELNIVPNPDMVSQLYSSLPVQGPNDPRYYIDSSGELGLASDFFRTRLVQSNQDPNLYRDNSGELLYVYPKGSHPGNFQSGIPAAGNSAVLTV